MPDFTIEMSQQCMEWRTKEVKVQSSSDPSIFYVVTAEFSEQRHQDNEFTCTCPAYKYKGMDIATRCVNIFRKFINNFVFGIKCFRMKFKRTNKQRITFVQNVAVKQNQ